MAFNHPLKVVGLMAIHLDIINNPKPQYVEYAKLKNEVKSTPVNSTYLEYLEEENLE